MCKFIGKSNEWIFCNLSKSEIMLAWKQQKWQILPVTQNLSSIYFPLAKFQLVSSNPSLAIIWQMTYTQKMPKLSSATLISPCIHPSISVLVSVQKQKWELYFLKQQYHRNRPIRLTQCCTQFKSPGVKILCVLYL